MVTMAEVHGNMKLKVSLSFYLYFLPQKKKVLKEGVVSYQGGLSSISNKIENIRSD